MSSLPAPRPDRKPLEPVAAVGRLLAGHGQRLPELIEGNAILEIETEGRLESYWCGLILDPADGHISGVKLQKFATGEKYNLPATLDDCDCPDGTYRPERPLGCRHQVALRQALLAVANAIKTAPLGRP
jgi:hypothetical protein